MPWLNVLWLNVFFSPLIPCKIIGSAVPHPIVISYGIKPHTWSGMIQNGIVRATSVEPEQAFYEKYSENS